MKKFRILGIIFTMLLAAQVTMAAPFNAKAKTKRIPAGTEFQLKMLNGLDSSVNTSGNSFSAMLLTDQRGDIQGIVQPKRMSKGAILYLNFDHVVTPNGRQLPLTLNVVGRSDMTYDGGLTTTKGYADAWKQTCTKSGRITKNAISWGEDVANDSGWTYVTVPVCFRWSIWNCRLFCIWKYR